MNIEEICNNFFNDNKSLSSSVLISFQKQNSNTKSSNKINFINYVMNSKEFQHHYKAVFQQCYSKIFPSGDKQKYDVYIQEFMNTILVKKQRFCMSDVDEYFKQSDYFHDYFCEIIKNVYSFYYTNEINDAMLYQSLDKIKNIDFINSNESSVQAEINDIIKILPINVTTCINRSFEIEDYKQYYCDRYYSHFNKKPDIENITEFQQFIDNKKNFVDMYFVYKHKDYSIFFNQILNIFRSIFQRDLTIYEYVKYYDDFGDDTRMKIEKYKKTFDEKFMKMKNIYKSYLDETLDIYCFCEKYLQFMEIDIDIYEKKMIDIIIQYESYKNVMSIKIISMYKEIFNVDLLDRDMQYFFEQISKNKFSLINENLSKSIVSIKEETDDYVQTINDVYKCILRRSAIKNEIEKAIVYFRYQNDSNIKPNIQLENTLFECLEYHDVLKDIITQHLGNKCERTCVYDILARILHNDDKDIKRDKSKIIQLIDQDYD